MPEITATEASRSFADLLDAVEHRGETFVIVRRGKVIAQLEPARVASGARAKDVLAVRRAGRPRGAHDLIIAATALATARTVVTADLTGFDDFPGVVVRTPG